MRVGRSKPSRDTRFLHIKLPIKVNSINTVPVYPFPECFRKRKVSNRTRLSTLCFYKDPKRIRTKMAPDPILIFVFRRVNLKCNTACLCCIRFATPLEMSESQERQTHIVTKRKAVKQLRNFIISKHVSYFSVA